MGDVVSMVERGTQILERRGGWEALCAEALIAGGMWPEEAAEEVLGLEKRLGRGISAESAARVILERKGLVSTADDGDLE